jgi:hypothetical protein
MLTAGRRAACPRGFGPFGVGGSRTGGEAAAEEREPDPVPSHAWLLDGDGQPAAGDVVLTFDGTVELADGAAVFDGGSGFASTRAPGPIDTTASFSVAAWVSLHPPTDAGGWGHNTAVSQLGDVTADFGVSVAYGRWNFWMKDADANETGHTFRASAAIADPDPGTWVQGRRGGPPHRRHATRHATAIHAFATSDAALPNGTYGYMFTDEEKDVVESGFSAAEAAAAGGFDGEVTTSLRFEDGTWQQFFTFDGDVFPENGPPCCDEACTGSRAIASC